jgi:hypothetical protein
MATTRLSQLQRLAALAGAAFALALSSCALPAEHAIRKIRHEGPISYVAYEVGSALDPASRALPQNAPSAPYRVGVLGFGRTLTAEWVYGVPGFVRSPYAYPPKLVDVGGATPGSVIICPWTMKPFVVPPYLVYDYSRNYAVGTGK